MDDLEFYSSFEDVMSPEDKQIDLSAASAKKSISFELPEIGRKYIDGTAEKKSAESKEIFQSAKEQNKMIIGLSGAYAAGASVDSQQTNDETGELSGQEVHELLNYLQESIDEYERYVENIGRNGLAAANLNYYRDDIQEILDYLKYDDSISLKDYYGRIVNLDIKLRAKAPIHVKEIGYNNFKQYQIINDPPLTHWWWYLNRNVAPPIIQPKFWEIWKKI